MKEMGWISCVAVCLEGEVPCARIRVTQHVFGGSGGCFEGLETGLQLFLCKRVEEARLAMLRWGQQ
jgi:hypothetical protein